MTPDELSKAVDALLSEARYLARGGLTVSEFGSLTVKLIRLAVSGLDAISVLDGPAKKAWTLSCVAMLFDSVSDSCVPLAAKPIWWLAKPAIRALVLAAAGGAIEQILILTRAARPEPVE